MVICNILTIYYSRYCNISGAGVSIIWIFKIIDDDNGSFNITFILLGVFNV